MRERWWIDGEVEVQLTRACAFDVAQWSALAAAGTWLSSDRQSAAARVETASGPLFVKWRHTAPGRGRKTLGRASRERREARACLALAARSVKAPLPWAVGERRRAGMLLGSVLVRPFYEGCEDARAKGLTDPPLVRQLARDLRTWHDAGFRHGDCYPKNVLVPGSGAAPFPVGCPAARFRRAGTRLDRRRRKDLAQWAAGALEIAPDADPFAFLATYCEVPGLDALRVESAIRPHLERVLAKQAERRRTQPQREPDGPPRPAPLPESEHARRSLRPIATLLSPP